MPYIKMERRGELDFDEPETSGELNYAITRLVQTYLGRAPKYDDFNSVIGALESAKLELYRRMISPYEDKKIIENGDVY